MSINGPLKMYKIRPLYDFSPAICLPTCMYKMSNLYDEQNPAAKDNTPNVPADPVEQINEDGLKLLEIEKHQLNILQKLEDLKNKVLKMKEELGVQIQKAPSETIQQFQDIVVKANAENPPLSLWAFYKLLSLSLPAQLVTFIHSSIVKVPDQLHQLQNLSCSESPKVSLSIIWKNDETDTEMVINPVHQGVIAGEVNIARYIARLLCFNYDSDPIVATQIDDWLEIAHSSIIHGNNKERQAALKSLNSHLGKSPYLVSEDISLADIVLWSSLVQSKLHNSLPANVTKWYKSLMDNDLFAYCKSLPFL